MVLSSILKNQVWSYQVYPKMGQNSITLDLPLKLFQYVGKV